MSEKDYSISALVTLLRITQSEIREALSQIKNYRTVRIPKKKGGYRVLFVPSDSLKMVQRRILRYILQRLVYSRYVRILGLYKKTSYVRHAERHKEGRWFFQFDLKDAFSSVNIPFLQEILFRKILAKIESFEIANNFYQYALDQYAQHPFYSHKEIKKIEKDLKYQVFYPLRGWFLPPEETEEKKAGQLFLWDVLLKEELAQELANLIIKLAIFQNHLPQGAPTSPFLYYLALTESGLFDELVKLLGTSLWKDKYKPRLSVYVDNFVISSQRPIPFEIREKIFETIRKAGFEVNPKKTRNQDFRHGSPLITGLRIIEKDDERKVSLPKKKVRQLRGLIHRAAFKPELISKVEGVIASLKPIYGKPNQFFLEIKDLPSQLAEPCKLLLEKLEKVEK
jgi:hypothetical protein